MIARDPLPIRPRAHPGIPVGESMRALLRSMPDSSAEAGKELVAAIRDSPRE